MPARCSRRRAVLHRDACHFAAAGHHRDFGRVPDRPGGRHRRQCVPRRQWDPRPGQPARNAVGVRENPDDLARSVPVLVADMQDSLFYPYAEVHGGEMYLSYTVDRKHIRLARVDAWKYLKG